MKYMVIETFKPGKADAVYARFNRRGRLLPDGLYYIHSWLAVDRSRCFQLMETEKAELLDEWISKWNDLLDFEIVPVADSPTQGDRSGGGPDAFGAGDR